MTLTFDSSWRRRHPRADSATSWSPPRRARTWPRPRSILPAGGRAHAWDPRRHARGPPHILFSGRERERYTPLYNMSGPARQSAGRVVLRYSSGGGRSQARLAWGQKSVKTGAGLGNAGAAQGAAGVVSSGPVWSSTKRGLLSPPVSCGGLQL